jgi:hypothetical protein
MSLKGCLELTPIVGFMPPLCSSRRCDPARFGIDNPDYRPMLKGAAIEPQNQSLEAPVLAGRRLTF